MDDRVERRHLSSSILSVGASRASSLAVIALTSILVARILGPAGIGTLAVAQALILVLAIGFELGLPQAVAYYAGRGEWSGSALARGVVGSSFALAIPAMATLLAGFALIGDHLPDLSWPMVAALALALPFCLLWRIGPQAALAQERFEAFAALDASPAFFAFATAVAGAAVAGTDGAVIGLAVGIAGGGIAVIAWLAVSQAGRESIAPPGGARAVLAFGLPAWVTEVLMQVNLRIALVFVAAFVGATESGVFSISLSTTSVAWTLIAAFAVSALPRAAGLHAESEQGAIGASERDERDARAMRHAVLTLPVVAIGIVLLLIAGVPLLYGASFEESIRLGLILLPGSLALGVGMTAIAILLGRGEKRRVLLTAVAVVPLSVAAYVVAIRSHDADGAAVVSTVSYTALSLAMAAQLRSVCDLAPRDLLWPRRDDLGEYRDVLAGHLARLRRQG